MAKPILIRARCIKSNLPRIDGDNDWPDGGGRERSLYRVSSSIAYAWSPSGDSARAFWASEWKRSRMGDERITPSFLKADLGS